MIETRISTVWLAAVATGLGLYLLFYPDIRIMPEIKHLLLTVQLTPGYMAQDRFVNEVMVPLEEEISRLGHVDDIESITGPDKAVMTINLQNVNGSSSLMVEIQRILNQTGADYHIETSLAASHPVFRYMVYASNQRQSVDAGANDFKRDLEQIPGIFKIETNNGIRPLPGIDIFKRYNGHRAVSLAVFIKDRDNMAKTIARCKALKRQYQAQYDLNIESLGNGYQTAQHRVFTLHLFFLITALTVFGIGFLQGRNFLFAVLLALVGYEVSILLLQVTDIRLNMVSVVGLFLFTGYGLAIAVTSMGFNQNSPARQKLLILSAAGYCIIFSSALMITGIIGQVVTSLSWACLFSILIPLLLCSFALRFCPPEIQKGKPLFLSGMEKFWHLAINNRFIGLVVVLTAILMTIIPISGWKSKGKFTLMPPIDRSCFHVWIEACTKTDAIRALTRMEETLCAMAEVDHVIADYGVIYPYLGSGQKRIGEDIAKLTVAMKPGTDSHDIKTSIQSRPESYGRDVKIRIIDSNMPPCHQFSSSIYCDTAEALEKFSNAYCDKLGTVPGISHVHSLMESDSISRKAGQFYNRICADMDESITMKSRVMAQMQSFRLHDSACDVQYDPFAEPKSNPGLPSGIAQASGISLAGLLLALVLMGVVCRSATVLLIPFSAVFIFAGTVCFTNQFSMVNFLSILGIQSVWTVKLLMVLTALNAGVPLCKPDQSDKLVSCMKQAFASALVIYIPLVTGAVFLWAAGDFGIRPIGLSFTGGLIYLAYLELAVLPVIRSAELKLFAGKKPPLK